MFQRLLKLDCFGAMIFGLVITWPLCWVLVYKFGWRYNDLILGKFFTADDSFMAFLMLSNLGLVSLFTPFLAFNRAAKRNKKNHRKVHD